MASLLAWLNVIFSSHVLLGPLFVSEMQMVQLEGNTEGDILLKMESEVMQIGVDCSPFMIPENELWINPMVCSVNSKILESTSFKISRHIIVSLVVIHSFIIYTYNRL